MSNGDLYCYSQNLNGVYVINTTQPATFTPVNGDTDALDCCDVDRSTASDFSGLITRPF